MNLLLGRRNDGFVSVALVPGYGITVFDFRRAGNAWNQVASESCDIPLDAYVPFELRGETAGAGSLLEVRIDGRSVASVELPVPIDGPWGLGAQGQSAGIWRQVRFAKR